MVRTLSTRNFTLKTSCGLKKIFYPIILTFHRWIQSEGIYVKFPIILDTTLFSQDTSLFRPFTTPSGQICSLNKTKQNEIDVVKIRESTYFKVLLDTPSGSPPFRRVSL